MVSVCPTLGGSNPGLRAELIHSVQEKLSLICGCAFMTYPSAFASVSVSSFQICQNLFLHYVIYCLCFLMLLKNMTTRCGFFSHFYGVFRLANQNGMEMWGTMVLF